MTQNKLESDLRPLAIFQTMRSNLAMADSFLRNSCIEVSGREVGNTDLRFLGVQLGEKQIKMQNESIIMILTALLYQVLENYFEMVRLKPSLKDQDLEEIFDQPGDRERFIDGMRIIRNFVFHLARIKGGKMRSVEYFSCILQENGGAFKFIFEIQGAFHNFVGKCFLGDLRVWPDEIYDLAADKFPDL